jgi:hypothetical protein
MDGDSDMYAEVRTMMQSGDETRQDAGEEDETRDADAGDDGVLPGITMSENGVNVNIEERRERKRPRDGARRVRPARLTTRAIRFVRDVTRHKEF